MIKAVAVNEDGDTFFRKKTIGFDGKTAVCECVSSFNEPLTLSQSEKCFGEIVCGSVSLQSPQITLSQNRTEIKTSASVHVLCEEENNEGAYFVSEKTMPISLTFPQESFSDFKHATADLEVFDTRFTPELDQYGESRVIKAEFSVRARLKINEPKAYTVADDMFEKEFDSVQTLKTVSLPQILSQSEVGFSTEAKLPPATPKIEAILDSSVRELGTSAEKRENGAELSGSFIVTLLTKTEEGVQSFDHTVSYSQLITAEPITPDCEISAECLPLEVLTTLHSDGSTTARVIASARVSVYSEKEESFISEIGKRAPIAKSDNGNSLIYCYVQNGEELWSVAKLYRTDPAALREANPDSFNEQGKSLQSGKPILIKA